MGDEEPGPSTCFLLTGGWCWGPFRLGEDRDTAGAGTCGEVRRVRVDGVDEWD